MKKIYIILFMLMMIILSACQPMPDKPVVIEKNGDIGQKIMQTAEPQQSLPPDGQKWQETLAFQGGVQINVDAEVDVPKVSSFPVAEVKPHEPTKEEAQKFVDYFMKGKPLYEPNYVHTKDYFMKYIISAQAGLAKAKNGTYDFEDKRQKDIDMYTRNLKNFQEEYDNAPAKAPDPKPAAVEFKKPDYNTGIDKNICVKAFLEKDIPSFFGVYIMDNNESHIVFMRNDNVSYKGDFDATDTLAGVKITRLEAQAKADELLKELNMADLQLTSTKEDIGISDFLTPDSYKQALSELDRSKCFEFKYTRLYNNIPITNVEQFYGDESENASYDEPWSPEGVSIMVNDDGVVRFEWDSPGDVGNVVNSDVKLMSFDDIKNIFRKQIFYQRTWGDPNKKNTMTIKKAALGLMRVKMKNENRYTLMPVWDFIGDFSEGTETDTKDVSFLTLNAIDGSNINRFLGY